MKTVKPVRFEIRATGRGFVIDAYMDNGTVMPWGKDIKTERGAKARLTQFAKRHLAK